MVDDKTAHRAAVDAGYASLQGYIEQWGHEVVSETQKRYADDITLQELVRLRVENERLREALTWIERHPVEESKQWEVAIKEIKRLARYALQQKDSE